MNAFRFFIFLGLILGFQLVGKAQKAEPNCHLNLKMNGKKIELVNTKVAISELKNAKLELFCKENPVTINSYKITYSSKKLDMIASLEGEGQPSDLSSPKWKEGVEHQHLHAGGLVMIRLFYTVDYLDEDAEKETTWMIELE